MPNITKLILALIVILQFIVVPFTFAQSKGTDISFVYQISDKEAESGDILVNTADKGLVRSAAAYDNHLFGVLQGQDQPLMVYKRLDNEGQPVARNGTTQVNVTTINGPISAGDYITSSEIPGKGAKGTLSGYVIGVALTPFAEKDGQQVDLKTASGQTQKVASGKITIALKIEYAELSTAKNTSRLVNSFGAALFKNVEDPGKFVQVLRYLAAAVTVLISFGVGFVTFSRSIPKGVEAIGRNPLAEKAILFSIILNIFFTILTASVGIVAAAFILRL